MSSSPTAPTSTTGSSTARLPGTPLEWIVPLPVGEAPVDPQSRSDRHDWGERPALVACGALAQPAAEIAARRGWAMDVHPLPPLLHNQPQLIAGEVRRAGRRAGARPAYDKVAIGYADCGTYGALDAVCAELGLERLPGLHCYDVFAGPDRLAAFFDEQPGTYLFTDFLVRSFTARSSASSAWTAGPSCATTTSSATPAWSGWPRSPTPSCTRSPRRPPRSSGCR